jgi:hypothetical protein
MICIIYESSSVILSVKNFETVLVYGFKQNSPIHIDDCNCMFLNVQCKDADNRMIPATARVKQLRKK